MAKKGARRPTKKGKKQSKKAEDRVEAVEEVQDAVTETVSVWRAVLRPRVIITTIAFIALLLLVWLGFKTHAAISEGLSMTLTPTSITMELAHGEDATGSLSLRTNNYLFCEASCGYTLRDESRNVTLREESGIILQDTTYNLSFPFAAPDKGEGQMVYHLEIACQNKERFLCARSGEKHRASALITLDYGLSDEEARARATAKDTLPRFLEKTRELDLVTQEASAYADALRPDQEQLDGLGEEADRRRGDAMRFVLSATRLAERWEEGDYLAIAAEGIPLDTMEAGLRHAKVLNDALIGYVEDQHRLVALLESFAQRRESLSRTLRTLEVAGETSLEAEGVVAYTTLYRIGKDVEVRPTENASSRLASATDEDAKLAKLEEKAAAILERENTLGERLLLEESARINLSVASGNATSLEERNALICEGLRQVIQNLSDQNLTANTTSRSYLSRCAGRNEHYPLLSLDGIDLTIAYLPGIVNSSSPVPTGITEHLPRCCFRGACRACCDGCEKPAPIIFLHGHSMSERNAPSYSLEAFSKIQAKLHDEGRYLDAGALTPFDATEFFPHKVWDRQQLPVSVRATYYYDSYLQGGSYILSVAKSESIDTYAIRLKDIIDTVRFRTGRDRVTVVAHSMGGLVVRRYLQLFGDKDVDRLIMVGTPNQGVESNVATLCPWLGADKECTELRAGSAMLAKINDPSKQSGVPMHVIYGTGCEMEYTTGDGVVTERNAQLDGVPGFEVEGSCPSLASMHIDMLDPDKYPSVYEELLRELD